jgi:NADH:ubiquinone oxidoreductase subunit B-like Fe-S oxidoreductase
VFIDSRTLDGPLDKHLPVDVYVPGCPPRPDAIVAGVVKAATLLAERGYAAENIEAETVVIGDPEACTSCCESKPQEGAEVQP